MLVIDTRIKLLLFILINFMVFGLKDFILGSVCFAFICVLSCLMGQKKNCIKVHNLLFGDCGYTTVMCLSSSGYRNDLVDFHAIHPCNDTCGAFRIYFYCNYKS